MNVSTPNQVLWILIGLVLTISGTLLEAFVMAPGWVNGHLGLQAYSLGVTCQIGAVLLISCLGGKNAATISQIAYLLLGLTWFNVFTQGGGFDYVLRPSFGYLLGFIPGAWICGVFAFRLAARLEAIALSCLAGLLTIHATGIGYLITAQLFHWSGLGTVPFWSTLMTYSLAPLPGQLAVICAVTVIAFTVRHILFY